MELTFKWRKTQTTNQIRKLQSTLEDELQRKNKEGNGAHQQLEGGSYGIKECGQGRAD